MARFEDYQLESNPQPDDELVMETVRGQTRETKRLQMKNLPANTSTGGLTKVAKDSTLTGDGTNANPLGVAIPFTAQDEAKLRGIEDGATADQTAEEIKTALETLTGDDRLDASAVKNIPSGGRGGVTLDQVNTAIDNAFDNGILDFARPDSQTASGGPNYLPTDKIANTDGVKIGQIVGIRHRVDAQGRTLTSTELYYKDDDVSEAIRNQIDTNTVKTSDIRIDEVPGWTDTQASDLAFTEMTATEAANFINHTTLPSSPNWLTSKKYSSTDPSAHYLLFRLKTSLRPQEMDYRAIEDNTSELDSNSWTLDSSFMYRGRDDTDFTYYTLAISGNPLLFPTGTATVKVQHHGDEVHTTYLGQLSPSEVYKQAKEVLKAGNNITIASDDNKNTLTLSARASEGGASAGSLFLSPVIIEDVNKAQSFTASIFAPAGTYTDATKMRMEMGLTTKDAIFSPASANNIKTFSFTTDDMTAIIDNASSSRVSAFIRILKADDTVLETFRVELQVKPTATVQDATTTRKGIIEIATQTEADAGTDTTRAMTPALVKRLVEASGGGEGGIAPPQSLVFGAATVNAYTGAVDNAITLPFGRVNAGDFIARIGSTNFYTLKKGQYVIYVNATFDNNNTFPRCRADVRWLITNRAGSSTLAQSTPYYVRGDSDISITGMLVINVSADTEVAFKVAAIDSTDDDQTANFTVRNASFTFFADGKGEKGDKGDTGPAGGGITNQQATTIADTRARARYTDVEKTKLAGIQAGAEANVGVEYTQAEKTKLTGIEAGAEKNVANTIVSSTGTNLTQVETIVGITQAAYDGLASKNANTLYIITG